MSCGTIRENDLSPSLPPIPSCTKAIAMSVRSFLGATLMGFVLQASFVHGADAPPAADLYVSPQGQDSWSGKLAAPNAERTDGPLASLEGPATRSAAASRPGRWPRRCESLSAAGRTAWADRSS